MIEIYEVSKVSNGKENSGYHLFRRASGLEPVDRPFSEFSSLERRWHSICENARHRKDIVVVLQKNGYFLSKDEFRKLNYEANRTQKRR